MSTVFIGSYNSCTPDYDYRMPAKKPANLYGQIPPAAQYGLEPPGQSESTGKKQNALLEVFEKMRNRNPDKGNGYTIDDPFGLIRKTEGALYASHANENGVIEYNGVEFTVNKNGICLGDVSNLNHVISIPLSTGESLMVNRNCIGELSRAIGMFSPEDQNRILRALQMDAKIQEVKAEIEEMGDDVGKSSRQQRTDSVTEVQGPDGVKDTLEETFETESEVIVKPDGSKVLVMTMNIGGMKTVTSMEISKPDSGMKDVFQR